MHATGSLYESFDRILRPLARLRTVRKGQPLFVEGDPYRGPFYVESGRFKIYLLNECGKELILSTFQAGDWMATPPVFLAQKDDFYHASSQALESSCVHEFPAAAFRALLRQNPDLMFDFATVVVGMTFAFQRRLKEITLLSVQDRLEEFLKQLGGCKEPVQLPVHKQEIAALLGTTPESVSRAIRALVENGKLKISNGSYWLEKSESNRLNVV